MIWMMGSGAPWWSLMMIWNKVRSSLWAWPFSMVPSPHTSSAIVLFYSSVEDPFLFIASVTSSWSMSLSLNQQLPLVSFIGYLWNNLPHLQTEALASISVFLQRQVLISLFFAKPPLTLLCPFLRCSEQDCARYLRQLWLCIHDDSPHFVG